MNHEWVRADLHIHSVLSPCAGRDMLPLAILEEAYAKGLTMIAITDHNSTANLPAFMEAAKGFCQGAITVIPGIEVQCAEEVHLIGLFPGLAEAQAFYLDLRDELPARKNNDRFFGEQWLLDTHGGLHGLEKRLLLQSVEISLEQVTAQIKDYGGIAIAAHVDRPMYSLLAVLGFVPKTTTLDALEVSSRADPNSFARDQALTEYPILAASDAHYLADIGKVYITYKGENSFQGLYKALVTHGFDISCGDDVEE